MKNSDQLNNLTKHLSNLRGEAHQSFRQSIINEMVAHRGYSAVRAAQVVDLLERHARAGRA